MAVLTRALARPRASLGAMPMLFAVASAARSPVGASALLAVRPAASHAHVRAGGARSGRAPRQPRGGVAAAVVMRPSDEQSELSAAGAATARDRPPVPLPRAPKELDAFCAACVQAGAPRKLSRAYTHALEGDAFAEPWALDRVVRALIKLSREDLAAEVHAAHHAACAGAPGPSAEWCEASQRVVRACVRASQLDAAEGAWARVAHAAATGALGERADALRAAIVPSLACAHLRNGDERRALSLLAELPAGRGAAAVSARSWAELVRWFGKCACFEGVHATLVRMEDAGVEPSSEANEFLGSAAVKSVEFLTGAVDIAGLPAPGCLLEAAFVGRSNVGKSSLLNMLTARRAVAYTSSTPGKTQQFNYFGVNTQEPPGRAHARFLLADLPGVGYAKVPRALRQGWEGLFAAYLQERHCLRLVCHLVDGNHGVKPADLELMGAVAANLPPARGTVYAVVLTKLDRPAARKKITAARASASGGANAPAAARVRAPPAIEQQVRTALADAGLPADTPILATSAKDRRGRAALWRLLGTELLGLPSTFADAAQGGAAADG